MTGKGDSVSVTVRYIASLIRLRKAARDRSDYAAAFVLEGRIAAALR